MYLGTGEPSFATLIPNRMFKNVGGSRFSEITGTSGTGHLQKGHGVACGDWDRDGDNDVFVETGGAVNGDRFHDVLFQNPGQGNHWLTVKLVGKKTNRAAIGARIKVVTSGAKPLTIHRHVSSGSSFGANPLQQTIGVAQSNQVAVLEIHWPTSGTTQVFRDIAVDQAIEVTEFADSYRPLNWKALRSRNEVHKLDQAKISIHSMAEDFEESIDETMSARVHAYRAARSHRDHRCVDRTTLAGRAGGAARPRGVCECTNNLKQMGLALHNYASGWDCFPPFCVTPTNVVVLPYSVHSRLLQFVEQGNLYNQINFSISFEIQSRPRRCEWRPFCVPARSTTSRS